MKVSGNANAASFFKKHGITEAQMQSEKKYHTKAAQEYRKHIIKLVQEEAHPHTHAHAHKSEDAQPAAVGLDSMMESVAPAAAPVCAPNPAPAPAPRIVVDPTPATTVPATVFTKPIGKLSIAAATETATPALQSPASSLTTPTSEADPALAMKLIGKPGAKKPTAVKKGLGARKLDTSAADGKLVSFDVVEERKAKVEQEEEDRKLAKKLSEIDMSGESGSSRIAAALRDADEPTVSKYRPAPTTASSTSMTSSSIYRAPSGPTVSGSTAMGESHAARDKYGKAKSISSDQYFGLDQADQDRIKTRIDKFSNARAISSAMVYGDEEESPYSSDNRRADSGDGLSLEKLKDSVSGFFDDLQRRMN